MLISTPPLLRASLSLSLRLSAALRSKSRLTPPGWDGVSSSLLRYCLSRPPRLLAAVAAVAAFSALFLAASLSRPRSEPPPPPPPPRPPSSPRLPGGGISPLGRWRPPGRLVGRRDVSLSPPPPPPPPPPRPRARPGELGRSSRLLPGIVANRSGSDGRRSRPPHRRGDEGRCRDALAGFRNVNCDRGPEDVLCEPGGRKKSLLWIFFLEQA